MNGECPRSLSIPIPIAHSFFFSHGSISYYYCTFFLFFSHGNISTLESLNKMENLTDSPLYEKFAYHVALLHQFVMDVPKGLASFQNLPKRSNSVGPKPSSVHGSSVFAGLSKDKKADGALRRANSSDGLIRMATAAEKLSPS